MTNLAQRLLVVLTTSESVLGISCNGFICLVNCISLVKKKKVSFSDLIITSLAISRICLLSILIPDILTFSSDCQEGSKTKDIFTIIWAFINFLSIWLATCLSIFYCLKIANFSHHAFLWLKWRASHVITWILLASVLFSFFSTWTMIKESGITFSSKQVTPTTNFTEDIRIKKSIYFSNYIFTGLWMVIPFNTSLISYVLIILSLRRHIQQMQNNGTESRDPSTEAHVRATKIILSFLFLFITYLIAFFIILFSCFLSDIVMAWIIGEMVLAAHHSVHSIILLIGNKKLKQAFLRMFQIKK
ncbi:taste receptor type 2 member 3-like [Macrotis lagotis]|uniref:taste receptor type 2 member 3-like n=1 Tax=Macrotis lagotis TaxID=92651 RepID=UPI003D68FD5D